MLRLILVFLAVCATVPAKAGEASPAARLSWGFDRSDLTPHPGVVFGVLPNGMRYALMRNEAPAGGLSVRLHFSGGSSLEGDREQGFMHLIEHMIFHGSANIPEGALPMMLAHDGLRRWTDFNAFTSYDETLYRLDLSRSDARARTTALNLMREVSSGLVFTKAAVAGARQKVQDEIRARDAVQDRIRTAQNAFFMPGSPIARSAVAGTVASVGTARGDALQRLYDQYYVPERATLILVGDVDPAVLEAEVAARFSDWRSDGDPVRQPLARATVLARQGTKAHLFVDPAAPTIVTIASVAPLSDADAGAPRDTRFLEHLASEMLSRRLALAAARVDAPFAGANSAIYDHFSTARLARMEVEAKDRDWRRALQAGGLELRRALERGFTQSELDAQLSIGKTALARDAAPRTSSALADAIADAVGRRILFTAPADATATAAYLDGVRLDRVNAAFKTVWRQPGRLIFASHNRKVGDGAAVVEAAWLEVLRLPLP